MSDTRAAGRKEAERRAKADSTEISRSCNRSVSLGLALGVLELILTDIWHFLSSNFLSDCPSDKKLSDKK